MSRLLEGASARALLVGILTATTVVATAGAAGAQTYNRLVVFGDSLSDNGNLFAAVGQPPAPYFQGRFSSGPVFVELLGFNLARVGGPVSGSIDYAYGGSRTDTQAFPPGMRAQLASYTAAGGRFGANDLVSILGGANNIFQGLPAAGATANPAGAITPVALSAATDINVIVNTVAGAGAGTILVTNLPKLSPTPQFRNTPAAPLADFAVTTFNGALLAGLTTTAAAQPGSNIILMDLFKVGDVIVANPGAFGLTNITDPCFNGVSVCSTPGTYFYFDGVHPTATGHALLASLARDYLYYGDAGAQSAIQGETAHRHRSDGLDSAAQRLSSSAPWVAGTALSVGASHSQSETDTRGLVGESEADAYGARIALESGPSANLRFGVAGSFTNASVDAFRSGFDVESLALDIYGGWRSDNGLFANAVAGVARDNYDDIERQTALAPIVHTAETQGSSVGAKGQLGMWYDLGGVYLSPRVGLSWVSSDVEGYFEQGAAAAYRYDDRTVEMLSAEAGLRVEGGLGGGFGFYAEGGYRDSLDDNSDAVGVNIAGSPSRTLFREIEDPFGGQVLARAGVTGMIDRVRVAIGYRGRFGEHSDSHIGGVTLTLPL